MGAYNSHFCKTIFSASFLFLENMFNFRFYQFQIRIDVSFTLSLLLKSSPSPYSWLNWSFMGLKIGFSQTFLVMNWGPSWSRLHPGRVAHQACQSLSFSRLNPPKKILDKKSTQDFSFPALFLEKFSTIFFRQLVFWLGLMGFSS